MAKKDGFDRRTIPKVEKVTEVSTWADLVRYLRGTMRWSQKRTGEEFGLRELAVRNWEIRGSLPNCGLVARHMATLVTPTFSEEEVNALSLGAYLDPPKKVLSKRGRNKPQKKRG